PDRRDIRGSPASTRSRNDASRRPRSGTYRSHGLSPALMRGRGACWCRTPRPTSGRSYGIAAPFVFPCRRPAAAIASTASVDDDVKVLAALHNRVGLEAQAAVASAFTGLDIVFVTVPGAHEMCLDIRESLAEPS